MPTRPLPACAEPGCRQRATRRGRCDVHARMIERERGSAASRGYDATWRGRRLAFLRRYPDCEVCGAPATQAHHVERLRTGGGHDDDNLVALCASCHSRETATVDTHRSYERRA